MTSPVNKCGNFVVHVGDISKSSLNIPSIFLSSLVGYVRYKAALIYRWSHRTMTHAIIDFCVCLQVAVRITVGEFVWGLWSWSVTVAVRWVSASLEALEVHSVTWSSSWQVCSQEAPLRPQGNCWWVDKTFVIMWDIIITLSTNSCGLTLLHIYL